MRGRQKVALGAVVCIAGITAVVAMIGFGILILAGLSMLLCNWVLPMFDIQYPITFMQGCGVGIGVMIVRTLIGSVFSVNVSK